MVAISSWQWEYNDLVIGANTPYELTSVDGFSPPDIRLDDTTKMADHGGWLYGRFVNERVWTFAGGITGVDANDFVQNELGLRAALVPQNLALPLRMSIPGWRTLRSNCIPSKLNYTTDLDYGILLGHFTFELIADDPRLYDDNASSEATGPEVFSGMSFSTNYSITFNGGSSGMVDCFNDGLVHTDPVITVTGACTNPRIFNLSESRELRVNITLGTSDVLTIDSNARTVTLNGTSSRYSSLDTSSTWWDLAPGDNTVLFLADSIGIGASCTMSFRSAWF